MAAGGARCTGCVSSVASRGQTQRHSCVPDGPEDTVEHSDQSFARACGGHHLVAKLGRVESRSFLVDALSWTGTAAQPRTIGESMTVPRLTAATVALLCSCLLFVAGCGSAVTAETTITAESAVSTQTSLASDAAQLYPVVVDGKLGYINSQGEIVIKPQFVDWPYSRFSEGLAPVSVGGKFGYIDGTGSMVIQPQFAIADPFSEGLAAVVGDNNLWGFIDKTGAVVVPMQYEQPWSVL